MFTLRRHLAVLGTAALGVGIVLGGAAPAQATIHPIVQSVACAAAQAREHVAIGDPPGQTPEGLTSEAFSVSGTLLTITFGEPLLFDQSDFRALLATKFIDEVVTNADGEVTAVIVDLATIPKAASGQGFANCANG